MTLPFIISFISILITIFCIFVSIRLVRQKKQLEKFFKAEEKDYEEKNYQLVMLESIQKELDYSLESEKIVKILSKSFQDFIAYGTVTSLVLKDDKLIFHTTLQDKVSKQFLEKVHTSMIASVKSIVPYTLPLAKEETLEGDLLEYTNSTEELASLFHIPLIISNQVVGMITLASSVAQYYAFTDMILLYKTMQQATGTVTALREVIETEKQRLTSLITSLHDGIIMIDENDILQVVNNSAEDILKIHNESPTMFDVMQALSKTYPIDEKIKLAKQTNKTFHEKEVVIDEKTVQIDITPVIATSSYDTTKEPVTKVIGTSIVLHDITLEKSLNQLKEDFTNEIVHELRSPLTAIKASAMLIATDTSLPAEHEKMIHIIVQESERMLGDITSLLDAAKLETGKFSVMQKATDITRLVDDSVTLFKTAAENKKIELVKHIGENLPPGLVDSSRIGQVINNLISNSMKFTQENGMITVSASYHYNEHLPTTKTNPGILISVSDTGVGIAKDKQGILFSKFGQIQNQKYKPKEAGTGLGLYVSKGIVEAHGGSMYLESEEGKGTTISFTVPLAPEKITAKIITAKELLQPGIPVLEGVH